MQAADALKKILKPLEEKGAYKFYKKQLQLEKALLAKGFLGYKIESFYFSNQNYHLTLGLNAKASQQFTFQRQNIEQFLHSLLQSSRVVIKTKRIINNPMVKKTTDESIYLDAQPAKNLDDALKNLAAAIELKEKNAAP